MPSPESDKPSRAEEAQTPQIAKFSRFFRSYGIAVSVVISSVPIMASVWDLLPQFESLKPLLTMTSSFSSLLLVAFIFANRHALAKKFFPGIQSGSRRVAYARDLEGTTLVAYLPAVLWLAAILSLISYFALVNSAVQEIAFNSAVEEDGAKDPRVAAKCSELQANSPAFTVRAILYLDAPYKVWISCGKKDGVPDYRVRFEDDRPVKWIKASVPAGSVPLEVYMGIAYLLAFATATSAFVLTGLKDFLQAEIGLTDKELILQRTSAARQQLFPIEGIVGLYGKLEYSPEVSELEPEYSGPFCDWHNERPEPDEPDPATGRPTRWVHRQMPGKEKEGVVICPLKADCSAAELDARFHECARSAMRRLGRKAS